MKLILWILVAMICIILLDMYVFYCPRQRSSVVICDFKKLRDDRSNE